MPDLRTIFDNAPVGKRVGGKLYVHRSAEDLLPAKLRQLVTAGKKCLGQKVEYNLVKLDRDGESMSFLRYDAFDSDPHPALLVSVHVNLGNCDVSVRDYSTSENPPILHRKELFVAPDYYLYDEFRELTEAEEAAGLLDKPPGFLKQWNALVNSYLKKGAKKAFLAGSNT